VNKNKPNLANIVRLKALSDGIKQINSLFFNRMKKTSVFCSKLPVSCAHIFLVLQKPKDGGV
jgi:hypothetical protein